MYTTWVYSVVGPWIAKRAEELHGKDWTVYYNCWLNMAMCYVCHLPRPPDVEAAVRCICRYMAVAKASGVWRFPVECLPREARELAERCAHKWIQTVGEAP